MKLIKTIENILMEDNQPNWIKRILNSKSSEELDEHIKLFGNIETLYSILQSKGFGDEFLSSIAFGWDTDDYSEKYLIDALGGLDKVITGKVDQKLLDKYLLDKYVSGYSDLISINGQLYINLNNELKKDFFGNYNYDFDNCSNIAKYIFNGEFENLYDKKLSHMVSIPDTSELINMLTTQNYEILLTTILNRFDGKPIDCGSNEFEDWVEEDNIQFFYDSTETDYTYGSNEKLFYADPNRFNTFFTSDDDRFKFSQLLDCSYELMEYRDMLIDIYRETYDNIIISKYYNVYNYEIESLLGKPLVKFNKKGEVSYDDNTMYNITKLFYDGIYNNNLRVKSDWDEFFVDYLTEEENLGCPEIEEPWYDDNEVLEPFNKNVQLSLNKKI